MQSEPPTGELSALKALRPDLYERGLALWETRAGVNELAWTADDAVAVVAALVDAGHCVLGGDVWDVQEPHLPRPTYENWYYEPSGAPDDGPQSFELAVGFIEVHRTTTAARFSVVWR